MRRHSKKAKEASFTLVELLVVLGIIVILASVVLAVGDGAIKAALRTKAQAMAAQIQGACLAYQNDYAVLPLAPTNVSPNQPQYGTSDSGDWQNLIYCLCGNYLNTSGGGSYSTNSGTPSNTRAIAYLQLNGSAVDTNGIPVNPINPGSGNYFNIALDGAYTGIITNVPAFGSGTMTNSSTSTVAASAYVWANCNAATGASNVDWWVHAP